MSRECWSEEKITERVRSVAKSYGRMPSASEMREAGDNSLACAISRHGGFKHWANRLNLQIKDSCTLQGRDMEGVVSDWLRDRGHHVERQTCKHPFDLMVDSQLRVDVKSANWTEYLRDGDKVSGFVFAGLKRGLMCDLFILVCLTNPHVVFLVPAHEARVSTLTITKSSLDGDGKYARFRERWEVIERSAAP